MEGESLIPIPFSDNLKMRSLGTAPIDPAIVRTSDAGEPFVYQNAKAGAARVFRDMVGLIDSSVKLLLKAASEKSSAG